MTPRVVVDTGLAYSRDWRFGKVEHYKFYDGLNLLVSRISSSVASSSGVEHTWLACKRFWPRFTLILRQVDRN